MQNDLDLTSELFAVCRENRLRAGRRIQFPAGAKKGFLFLLATASGLNLGLTQCTIQQVLGLIPRVKRSGLEVNHSHLLPWKIRIFLELDRYEVIG